MSARGKSRKCTPGVPSSIVLRAGKLADIAALRAIEDCAFAYDRLTARSFSRFLRSPGASLIVAEAGGVVSGYALTLFRTRSRFARLYSIAVDARVARRKIGSSLLRAAEAAALRRHAKAIRLEVK